MGKVTSLSDGISSLYDRAMSAKRYVIRPAYHYRPDGRQKFYLIYDTEFPFFLEHEAIQPNWIIHDDGDSRALPRFLDVRGISRDDVRLDVARVLKDVEVQRYLLRAK